MWGPRIIPLTRLQLSNALAHPQAGVPLWLCVGYSRSIYMAGLRQLTEFASSFLCMVMIT